MLRRAAPDSVCCHVHRTAPVPLFMGCPAIEKARTKRAERTELTADWVVDDRCGDLRFSWRIDHVGIMLGDAFGRWRLRQARMSQELGRGTERRGRDRQSSPNSASASTIALITAASAGVVAERSTKSLPFVRGLARTMSARPSPGTSGQAASKSATGSYTHAKRQRRRNTQRSDSAVNGRSRSSVTADRKVASSETPNGQLFIQQ